MSASLYNDHKCAEPGEVSIHFRINTSTGGAIGTLGKNRGFGTITRTGAGTYLMPLDRSYTFIMDLSGQVMGATVGSGKGCEVRIVSATLTGATPNLVIETKAADGTVADVTDGHVIFGLVTLKTASF